MHACVGMLQGHCSEPTGKERRGGGRERATQQIMEARGDLGEGLELQAGSKQ